MLHVYSCMCIHVLPYENGKNPQEAKALAKVKFLHFSNLRPGSKKDTRKKKEVLSYYAMISGGDTKKPFSSNIPYSWCRLYATRTRIIRIPVLIKSNFVQKNGKEGEKSFEMELWRSSSPSSSSCDSGVIYKRGASGSNVGPSLSFSLTHVPTEAGLALYLGILMGHISVTATFGLKKFSIVFIFVEGSQ